MSSYSAPADSPFDPTIPDLAPETPELEHVLEQAMRATMAGINVCVPAKVHAIKADQTVDLLLLPKTLYASELQASEKAILLNVPVSMPMGAQWSVRYPVAVGDLGIAVFADRNIDAYLAGSGGGPYDPKDTRMHDFSDAIFLPGLPTTSQQTQEGANDDLVVTNGNTQMRLTSAGKFSVKNQTAELLDVVNQLASQLSTLAQDLSSALVQVSSPGTPAPFAPSSIAQFSDVQAQVQAIVQTLATLKA